MSRFIDDNGDPQSQGIKGLCKQLKDCSVNLNYGLFIVHCHNKCVHCLLASVM